MKKIILFDLDETLIDSTEAIVEGFWHSFDVNDTPRPLEEEITVHVGHTLEDIFSALGVKEAKIDKFVLDYKEKYRTIATQKTFLLPFAKEAILHAKSFATLGVVTTKTGRYSKELLEHFGLLGMFCCVIGREDVINPKPHKEPILRALEIIGEKEKVDLSRVWMMGDTILDLQAASSANVHSIGLTCGYGDQKDLERYTQNIASNSLEAVQIIEKW
jgi:phosphoglycolate phosphatase